MTETALTVTPTGAQIAEQVIIKGDLAKLTEAERMAYYSELCHSLGLNPLTRPFEYIVLNGKLTLYPTRGAGDQLRSLRGISITRIERDQTADTYDVTAYGRDRAGREDASLGSVSITGLKGENLANAKMKAETKAKRRLTLSLAGLGWPDESEVADIPSAEPPLPRPSLADLAAQKAANLKAVEHVELLAAPMDPEVSARFINAEEVAEGAVAVERGLSRDELKDRCVKAGKSSVAIAKVIGCKVDEVGPRVSAMTDVERGVLADELGIEWRS